MPYGYIASMDKIKKGDKTLDRVKGVINPIGGGSPIVFTPEGVKKSDEENELTAFSKLNKRKKVYFEERATDKGPRAFVVHHVEDE